MSSLPLGKAESQQLEFKSAALLQDLSRIGRAVVAMLNAGGGEIWVGLGESDSRAVAVEPIDEPEREKRRLQDYLIDRIEPTLRPSEVVVVVEEGVLRIRTLTDRQVFALLNKGWRLFPIRVGDRTRSMTREEIFGEVQADSSEALTPAVLRAHKLRETRAAEARDGLWLRVVPVERQSLDLDDDQLGRWLEDPEATGNRRGGWHFARADHPAPKPGKEMRTWGVGQYSKVELHEDGGALFELRLESLYWKGEPNEIWPPLIIEYLVSALRIVGKLYEGQGSKRGRLVVELALFGLGAWMLRPGAPRWDYDDYEPRSLAEGEKDLLWSNPLVFEVTEVVEQPDRCGYRLVRRLYEAFGIEERHIPKLFDEKSGRLVMPEL